MPFCLLQADVFHRNGSMVPRSQRMYIIHCLATLPVPCIKSIEGLCAVPLQFFQIRSTGKSKLDRIFQPRDELQHRLARKGIQALKHILHYRVGGFLQK